MLALRPLSIPFSQVFHELIPFTTVALSMGRLDIAFDVRPATANGYHMVKLKFLMRKNSLFADVTPCAVSFKNNFIAHFFSGGLPLACIASHILFFSFKFVGGIVFTSLYSLMLNMYRLVFMAVVKFASSDISVTIVLLTHFCRATYTVLVIALLPITSHLGKVSNALSIILSCLFGVCLPRSIDISTGTYLAITTMTICTRVVFVKLFNGLFCRGNASRATFEKSKQGELLISVVIHSLNCLSSSALFSQLPGCKAYIFSHQFMRPILDNINIIPRLTLACQAKVENVA